ncbi:carbohydrate porin [Labilibacter sediminis]|nr:carbohydrate porin [Labilibacter sediminis]
MENVVNKYLFIPGIKKCSEGTMVFKNLTPSIIISINAIKMQQLKFLLLFVIIWVSSQSAISQEGGKALSYEVVYTGDVFGYSNSMHNPGSAYLGMVDLCLSLNTGNAGLWKNGEFYLQVENTHGARPSANMINDIQCISNIENGNYTYLYQLWYRQSFNKLSILLGVHDLNSEFLTSEYAGEYINSSFGIMPLISVNMPVSIFPKNTLGMVLRYAISSQLGCQLAVYDGDPLNLDEDPYCTNIKVNADEGLFSIAEIHFNGSGDKQTTSCYKLGAYYHSGYYLNLGDSVSRIKGNYGCFLMADQYLMHFGQKNKSKIGAFGQLGVAPSDRNMIDFYWAFGFNISSPFTRRSDDVFGIAIANALISHHLTNVNLLPYKTFESAIECMYKAKINKYFTVQPEFQYIINPGAQYGTNNALVGLIRSYISF